MTTIERPRSSTLGDVDHEPTSDRAILYLRVSTGLQAEKGMGLDVQRAAGMEYAAEHGLDVIDVVQEAASGGVKNGEVFSWEHRPALLQILERAKEGAFDVLLVARFDRLSRDVSSLTTLERMLSTADHPVRVVSAAEGEDNGDTKTARLMRNTLAGFAEYERDLIRERLAAGKQARKNQGRHVHGRVAYGYSSERGVLSPDPVTAETVRRMFAAARGGKSPGTIARELNAEGIPSPSGSEWEKTSVRRVLTNPVYTGERYGVKRAHEGIVTARAYNAVQAVLAARRRSA